MLPRGNLQDTGNNSKATVRVVGDQLEEPRQEQVTKAGVILGNI